MTGRRWLRAIVGVLSLGFAAVLLVLGVPWVTGVSWSEIIGHLAGLDPLTIAGLVVLWLAGLWAYTYLLTASLPGLTNLQAFTINAAGSAVSNLLPFGGAAGVAVTFAMTGSWGIRPHRVVVSTLVSGIWNALGRLALPALGLIVLLVAGEVPNGRLATAAAIATGVLAVGLAAVLAALWRESAAVAIGRAFDVASRVLPHRWRPTPGRLGAALVGIRQSTVDLVRLAWRQMTLAQLAYLGLQFALLVACLAVTGAYVGLAITFAAFALSRVLTTIVITPGGVGVSETGSAALLIALGVPAAPAAAGILLFAFFTFVIEIPVGGVAWATWTLAARWRRANALAADVDPAAAGPAPADPARVDTARVDNPRVDNPRVDTVRVDTVRVDNPRVDTLGPDAAPTGTAPADAAPTVVAAVEAATTELARAEAADAEPELPDTARNSKRR